MVLLVAGLALACCLQGAFFPAAQVVVAVPMVLGVLFAPRWLVLARWDRPILAVAGGLALWAVLDGALTGKPLAGLHYALLIAGVLALAGVCRQLPAVARATLVNGLLAVCGGVAVLGWCGVVVQQRQWGYLGGGLWRASSTLTYPNATAVVLAMAALVCLALRSNDRTSRWLGAVATIVLTGLVATLSRAGLGGLAVGLLILVVGLGWRPLLRAAAGPLLGCLVAVVGLLPAITAHAPTVFTVGTAVGAAAVGVVIGARVAAARMVWAVLVAGLGVAALPVSTELATRLTLASPDRWGSFSAAWQLFTRHPLTGVGPGLDQLVLARAGGGISVFRFAHNEYLQVLAELGLVGLLLLAGFLALVVLRLWRDRNATGELGIGGLAAVAALLLHAGFDFGWHIPAVPLLGAVFAGVALAPAGSTTMEPEGQLCYP